MSTQKKTLVIIGAGHAGISAALSAAKLRSRLNKKSEIDIIVISRNSYMTIRPRMYIKELEEATIRVKNFLTPIKVHFIEAEVTNIDSQKQSIIISDSDKQQKELHFDSLILCAGSELAQPRIKGIETVYNIDTYKAALHLRNALTDFLLKAESTKSQSNKIKVAVLGGGITGIELACELPVTLKKLTFELGLKSSFDLEVSIVDRGDVTYSLGEDPRKYLVDAFNLANVKCLNHASITEATQIEVDKGSVTINDEVLEFNFIVSALGMKATDLNKLLPYDKDPAGRIKVNQYLQTPNENIFIAGDAANVKVDDEHYAVMSCQQGRPQGRLAGHNAIHHLLGIPEMEEYYQPNYVTCVDLGEYGGLYTEGWERKIKKFGMEAREIKKHINLERIYPPNRRDEIGIFQEAGELQFIAPHESHEIAKKAK
ncbi:MULTISPECIES: NAD(P)/FAD-dependent oxidoreductase [unclassified Francisella]|uniref:NAD(P)/FAD-dependent oxidoreductase n=1 Tax=unclassified Francisella TaxID=2610885 RepID=UPI002E33BB09|nr:MULTISPECIES: FAD-dependent oxidoreductase [unclassified Francisella]MED7819346.1 FAD-dependent oxidoreductase [Francisella sp. 19S2-4]MED7830114.1 FAD-dependent oxidoreductase [Francisella sp. 19S2-10]